MYELFFHISGLSGRILHTFREKSSCVKCNNFYVKIIGEYLLSKNLIFYSKTCCKNNLSAKSNASSLRLSSTDFPVSRSFNSFNFISPFIFSFPEFKIYFVYMSP